MERPVERRTWMATRRGRALARLGCALALVGCEGARLEVSCPAGSPFVSARDGALCLDGAPFRFVGVNRYDVASAPPGAPGFACGRRYDDATLERMMGELAQLGVRVLRTWAFQSFTAGGTDFSTFDRLIASARRHDVRLALVLENEWRDCTEPDATPDGRKGSAWFAGGWLRPLGAQPLSYAEHLDAIVGRYRDEPQIALWQLMNEAEGDFVSLHDFARRASERVKAIDPNHLVSLGTMGTGQPGTAGFDYLRLHAADTLDLVEAHDYGAERDGFPQALANDLAMARHLGKPFFIGEAGIAAPAPAHPFSYPERAALFDAKLSAAFAAGVTGYLIWSYYDLSTTNWQGWDFGPGDPLAAVVARHAAAVR
jgi:endo-1,4-beta-mannosidase